MAAIDIFRPRPAGFGTGFSRFVGVVANWNDARVTRKALSKLSARELEDIGLCYGDIDDIAQKTRRF